MARPRFEIRSWNWGKGHLTIGPITIFGDNAMHGAIQIWLARKQTYLLLFPPWRTKGQFVHWWPWHAYLSPDGTPTQATWGIGPGFRREFPDA